MFLFPINFCHSSQLCQTNMYKHCQRGKGRPVNTHWLDQAPEYQYLMNTLYNAMGTAVWKEVKSTIGARDLAYREIKPPNLKYEVLMQIFQKATFSSLVLSLVKCYLDPSIQRLNVLEYFIYKEKNSDCCNQKYLPHYSRLL